MQYIEIEKDLIPYTFDIMLGEEMFVIDVAYNERIGKFVLSLYDAENNPLVYGEPLIYGQEVFASVRNLDFPIVKIVPLDPSEEEDEVTYDNLNNTIFLTVDHDAEEED